MITDALTEMKNHMRTYLNPFPETHPDRTKEMDFHTAVHLFESHLSAAWFEMEKNGENFSKDVVGIYAGNAIRYISEARELVNQFFMRDTPEDREYNDTLQQMEAAGVAEDPMPPEHNPAGYSPLETALYLNKVCLWWYSLFSAYAPGQPGTEINLPELKTTYATLLLLKHTGIYDFILNNVCNGTKVRAAALIAAIIGEKTGSVRVVASFLDMPFKRNKYNPYTIPAIENATTCLAGLKIKCKPLEEIHEKILSQKK